MYNGVLKGILSKRDRELIEMDTYYRREYSGDYKDAWYYGDESIIEVSSEWNSLSEQYTFEDYSGK